MDKIKKEMIDGTLSNKDNYDLKMHTFSLAKIKNGSSLTIGIGKGHDTIMVTDQHFNWFQKLMWKWCFGVKVEDYKE